jgi:hypothetical protein
VQAGKACADHDSIKVLSCASHLFLQFCCLNRRQKNSILRKPEELRSYAAFASRKAQTPLSRAANVCRHLLSANGSTCIRMTPEISREGGDPVYCGRGLLERGRRGCGNAWSI